MLSYRHPSPQRVWKGGSDLQFPPPFPEDPEDPLDPEDPEDPEDPAENSRSFI